MRFRTKRILLLTAASPTASVRWSPYGTTVIWQVEAQLFGGQGDGFSIKLDQLHQHVTVFRNGGPPFAVAGAVDASDQPDAARVGVYELARPLGPETPVYVASRI
jgi:hypothetical protein